MQAGIKHLPWVASHLPMSVEWNAGGLLAASLDEWHTNLRQLLLDEESRVRLGEAGYQKAVTRELNQMKDIWNQAIHIAIKEPMNRGFLPRNVSGDLELEN